MSELGVVDGPAAETRRALPYVPPLQVTAGQPAPLAAIGGLAIPLPYAVHQRTTYSIVPSNAVWRDPARADVVEILKKNERDNGIAMSSSCR